MDATEILEIVKAFFNAILSLFKALGIKLDFGKNEEESTTEA